MADKFPETAAVTPETLAESLTRSKDLDGDENDPQRIAAEHAAQAGKAKMEMDELQQRGEELLAPEVGSVTPPAQLDDEPISEPELPQIELPKDGPSLPSGDDLMQGAPGVPEAALQQMDFLAEKIPPRERPGAAVPPPEQRTGREIRNEGREPTAKMKRNLARENFAKMHELTAKAAEAGDVPPEEGKPGVGGIDEGDAIRAMIPGGDDAAALKAAWARKEDAEKEFHRALVELLEMKAAMIIENTRDIERIKTSLERARYY